MKNIIQKMQELGQKAAQFKQVIEAAPEQAAQLRETAQMTAGQLQQIRADMQAAVGGLRADTENRLSHVLQEIDTGADIFLEAGYQLVGVEVEVSPLQRIVVRLARVESVAESRIHALVSANAGRPTISALLTSLAKADALAGKAHFSNLSYRELVVQVGPTPSVRLCWRADDLIESNEVVRSAASPPSAPVPVPVSVTGAPPAPPALPTFGQGSFFEPRAAAPAVEAKPVAAAPPTPAPAIPAPAVKTVQGSDWKLSALDRFKKMPEASKYRR